MRLSDWNLRGLFGVNLFEQERSERKQQSNEDGLLTIYTMGVLLLRSEIEALNRSTRYRVAFATKFQPLQLKILLFVAIV